MKSWKDVDPSFPDVEMKLYGAGTDSGTFDYFTEEINGEEGRSRSDYSATEDDNVIVQGVSGDEGALGYFGLSYYEQNKDKLKAVEIDGGDGCVAPSVDTAQNGTYVPLSRPLFIYAKKESLTRPEVQAFIQYMLDNERGIAEAAQFVPLTDEQLTKAKAELGRGSYWPSARRRRPRLRSTRIRYGELLIKGLLALLRAHLRPDDRRDHRRALHPGVRVLPGGLDRRFLDGDGVGAALRAGAVRRRAAASSGRSRSRSGRCLSRFLSGWGRRSTSANTRALVHEKFLKPMLELLAGIPTIVYGYFALTFFTPLLRDLGVGVDIFNVLSAGLVMGVMILPTVASLSEDAMAAVPRDLRDGAFALGSTRREVATRIVVPAAISGVTASFVLGISRAVGETMIVLVAAGQQPNLTFDPRAAVETMSAFIAATGAGDVPTGSVEYKTIFAVGATLFVMTLILNVISIRLVERFREEYE